MAEDPAGLAGWSGVGPWDAALVTIGSVLGTGIFITTGDMARAPHPGLILLAWLVRAPDPRGALTYAELGPCSPRGRAVRLLGRRRPSSASCSAGRPSGDHVRRHRHWRWASASTWGVHSVLLDDARVFRWAPGPSMADSSGGPLHHPPDRRNYLGLREGRASERRDRRQDRLAAGLASSACSPRARDPLFAPSAEHGGRLRGGDDRGALEPRRLVRGTNLAGEMRRPGGTCRSASSRVRPR
jgi:hypothetical protein